MDDVADDKSYMECPVCGKKMSYSERLYVIPFYTLDDVTKSFSVVAKAVCWECFRGRVMYGDSYRPGGPRMTWTDEDASHMRDALWHISNSVTNGKSQDARCETTEWLRGLPARFVGPEGRVADGPRIGAQC